MNGRQTEVDGASSHSVDFDPAVGQQASEEVESLREEAVTTVTEEVYQQLGDQLAAFGETGKASCRDDIHAHLDYLIGSLVAGVSAPFGAYVTWLARLLEARGVPGDSLSLSVDRLEVFFQARMTPARFSPVALVLAEGRSALSGSGSGEQALAPSGGSEPVPPAVVELVDALIQGDRKAAGAILDAARAEEGYLGMAVGRVEAALRRVGELWQARQISVADEHLATAQAQRLLTEQFTRAYGPPPSDEHRALFACVPTNQHEVGLRILADSFELAGWRTEFLGADTPVADLIQRVGQFRPEVVGLSVALARQIPALQTAVAKLREDFGSDCPWLIAGGAGLQGVPGAGEQLGLDSCCAQAKDALEALS